MISMINIIEEIDNAKVLFQCFQNITKMRPKCASNIHETWIISNVYDNGHPSKVTARISY